MFFIFLTSLCAANKEVPLDEGAIGLVQPQHVPGESYYQVANSIGREGGEGREGGMKNLDEEKAVRVISLFNDPHSGGRRRMAPPEPASTPNSDAAAVRGLRSDDQETLRRLMDAHWANLVAFGQRILGGVGDPEDVAQTAFVRLWARRHRLDECGSLKALLYTIVRNASLDELRKRRRQDAAQEAARAPERPRTPYEDVQGAELQRLAAAAVARLPERRREVFRLAREEGLSYQEIAEVMGLSAQTVANHMSLAMADLRTALRPYLSNYRSPTDNNVAKADSDREQMDG
jgi:RNA polymerase sigma-70 factor (ECF subfamily)